MVQLAVWIFIFITVKSILFGIEYILENPLKIMTFALMGWIEDYPVMELLVVIVLVPVLMNGFAYWVQDNFLMKSKELE